MTPSADGWRGLSTPFCCAGHRQHCLLVGVDDDETMTEAEIDELFARTQPIGNALNALAQAELAVAAVDDLPPGIQACLDQVLADVLDEIQRPGGRPG